MRRDPPVRTALVAAAVAVWLGLGARLGAEEGAPPAPPKPLAKLEVPFLDGLVGRWDATLRAQGVEHAGADRWSKVLDGTAYLEELAVGRDASAFEALGLLRVGGDGKTVNLWWFDSMGQGGVWRFQGAVTADGFQVTSDEGGQKTTKALRRTAEGLAYEMTVGDAAVATGTWTKAAKDAPLVLPASGRILERPFLKAQLGEWTVTRRLRNRELTGTARFRLAVGGHCLVQEYEATEPALTTALSVSSLGADGRTLRTLWFDNYFPDPIEASGILSDTGWEGTGKHPLLGEMRVTFRKTEAGFETVYSQAGREMLRETYAPK